MSAQSKYQPGQFRGMSYEAASRMGLAIVQQAAKSEAWCADLDALIELREIMRLMANSPQPPDMREYYARLALGKAGFRLERTDHSDVRPSGYQILKGNSVVAGASMHNHELTLDEVVAFSDAHPEQPAGDA